MTSGVYQIFNKVTGETLYIGSSIDIEQRRKSHLRALRKGSSPCLNLSFGHPRQQASITVNYVEWKPKTYRGVLVHDRNHSSRAPKIFFSRNGFQKDLKAAVQDAIGRFGGFRITSSVDNYCLDSGERYDFLEENQ